MRFWAPIAWVVLSSASAPACGGRTTWTEDDASSGGAAATSQPPERAAEPARSDCDTLNVEIATARNLLTPCCATCGRVQCNAVVEDICCSASYTDQGANREVAKRFSEMVAAYKSKCRVACPPCRGRPAATCDAKSGRCAAF
jgi:hypothetical protein